MLWALAWTISSQAGVFPFEVESEVLENGLTVHVIPMESPGVVAYYTWMNVGSRNEVDPGRTGFAHFFEHLMFYGTEALGREERERAILRLGMEENAYTNLDETVYHGVLPAHGLERYIEIQADLFQNLALTEDAVQREAGAVYGEFRKSQASTFRRLYSAVQATAFTEHTYGHSTLGHEADIADMPSAFGYARTFFDRYYRPELTTLLVVGDADPEAVFAQVRKHYGNWSPATQPPAPLPPEPDQTETRRIEVNWDAPTAARLVMAWKIPRHTNDTPEPAHLELASNILFAEVGRLQSRLVREEAIAYDVFGWRDASVDPGLFQVWVSLKDPAHREAAETIILEEIADIAAGIESETLEKARSHARYRFLTDLEDPSAVASVMGRMLRRDPNIDGLDNFYAHYDAATPEQVAATVARYLVPDTLTVGFLSPPTETEAN
jgi:zinc protease